MLTTMHLVRKRQGWSSIVAQVTSRIEGLFFLYDRISKQLFLVDTGAEVSIIAASGLDTCTNRSGPLLLEANGSSIRTYGAHTLSLPFDSNTYRWNFVIADVSRPLLGADLLRSNTLLVNLKKKHLVDATTYQLVCMLTLDQIELLSLTWMPSLFPPITTICYSQTIPRSRCPISCSPLLGTEYFILFPPKDLLSMPMLDVCLQTNWQLPKLNLNVWIKWKLSGNLPVPGHHRCT